VVRGYDKLNFKEMLIMKASDLENEIDNLKTQILEKYHPEKIILFGSAAWGDEEVNDIDLLIIKSETPYYGIDRMRELDRLIKRDVAADMLIYQAR
jgi:uncharacterized protein